MRGFVITTEDRNISALIPAATVICLRDGSSGLEALLLRRNRDLKAFGGAWVFPGGRVDVTDAPGEDELTRAKAAAIREAYEETGLDISASRLEILSQWIPPVQEKRRFGTWFFVTRIFDDEINIDGGEIHDFKWVNPSDVVQNTPDPDTLIMPPTFVSLHQLTGYATVDTALDGIGGQSTERFETKFDRGKDGFVTYWEDDVAYHTGNLELEGPRHRLVAGSTQWIYHKSQ